jgi:hypothetical protein
MNTLQKVADYCFIKGFSTTIFMREIYMQDEYKHSQEGNDFYHHEQCVNMIDTLSMLGYQLSCFGIIKIN